MDHERKEALRRKAEKADDSYLVACCEMAEAFSQDWVIRALREELERRGLRGERVA